MAKQNLHSNAERRQLAISLHEDLSRYLEGKTLNAKDIAIPLAEALNSKVAFHDVRKALAAAVFGFTGLGSISSVLIGAPIATMTFAFGTVIAATGFVVSAKRQARLPTQFSNPEQIEWTRSDEAYAELKMYLNDVRSNAELVYHDGSRFEHMVESGWWYLAIAKAALSDRSKKILQMDEATVVLVFRPDQQSVTTTMSDHLALLPKKAREQDRNWLPDLSAAEFQALIDEFAAFDIVGKLQPWSRQLLVHGKRFSDNHKIEDGREFRREFRKHLTSEKIQHPNGRPYDAQDLAAVFCITNGTPPSACRRFLTNENYREILRLQQSGDQHSLPLTER